MREIYITFALIASPFALSAEASFDCAKASTEIENMICDSEELSRLDVSLSNHWNEYLKTISFEDVKALAISNQRNWLEWRSEDFANLAFQMQTRVSSLESDFEVISGDEGYRTSQLNFESIGEQTLKWRGALRLDEKLIKIDWVKEYLEQRGGERIRYALANGENHDFWLASQHYDLHYQDMRLAVIGGYYDDSNSAYPSYYFGANYFDLEARELIQLKDMFLEDKLLEVRAYFSETMKSNLPPNGNVESFEDVTSFDLLSKNDGLALIAKGNDKIDHFEFGMNSYYFQHFGGYLSELTIPVAPIVQYIKPQYRDSFAN